MPRWEGLKTVGMRLSHLHLVITVIFELFNSGGNVSASDECLPEFLAISGDHTMCLEDVGHVIALTSQEKAAILQEHNAIRASVSPPASDMATLQWDEGLASVAAKWSAQCTLGHDNPINRALPNLPGVWHGQNLAFGSRNVIDSIQFWATEKQNFVHGSFPDVDVAHYTQMVNAKTTHVGCGIASCPDIHFVIVCNYAPGQTFLSLMEPYTNSGVGCESCPQSCDASGHLCECAGVGVCLQGTSLDVSTCTCS